MAGDVSLTPLCTLVPRSYVMLATWVGSPKMATATTIEPLLASALPLSFQTVSQNSPLSMMLVDRALSSMNGLPAPPQTESDETWAP